VYPVAHAEQSTAASASQRVAPVPVATTGVPFGQVQTFATAVTVNAASLAGQVMAHDLYPGAAD